MHVINLNMCHAAGDPERIMHASFGQSKALRML